MNDFKPKDEFGAWRVHVIAKEDAGSGRGLYALAREMGITQDSVRNLLKRAPFEIPINLPHAEADALAGTLNAAGIQAEARVVAHASATRCYTHKKLANDGQCVDCGVWICLVCKAEADGAALCPKCFKTHGFWKLLRSVRVAILVLVLVGVASWGWNEQQEREIRREWQRPVRIGVVVLERSEVPDSSIRFLDDRLNDLEAILTTEFQRFNSAGFSPLNFEMVGDVPVATGPPESPPLDAGIIDNLKYSRALKGYVQPAIDSIGFDPDIYDTVIYVVATAPTDSRQEKFVEGLSELNGTMGLVEVDLDESMADLAAVAIGHEVFHTLGASDKYDSNGYPKIPEGLAVPLKLPRVPQNHAEIMGRLIPETKTEGRLPGLVGDIRVNRFTAVEIGWVKDGP